MTKFDFVSSYLSCRFRHVSPESFCRNLFPSGFLQTESSFYDGQFRGVCLCFDGSARCVRKSLVGDSLTSIGMLVGTDYQVYMAPVDYCGSHRSIGNARNLYAVAIDLDGIIFSKDGFPQGLDDFFYQASNGVVPWPTYVVSSGSGVHLYYVLDVPLRLWPDVVDRLSAFRADLIDGIWNRYVTDQCDNVQYESTNQAFRMPGTLTKDGHRAAAYRTGCPLSIDFLNRFVRPGHEIILRQVSGFSGTPRMKMSRERSSGKWTVNRALYDWWLEKIRTEARVGHRYWCIYCLAVFAQKCSVKKEELIKDSVSLIDCFNRFSNVSENSFTLNDVMTACAVYDCPRVHMRRSTIELKSGIEIPPNKRNGKSQSVHLKKARFSRDLNQEEAGTHWWDNGGRPLRSGSKAVDVEAYIREHPRAKTAEIAAALGISRTTAWKWTKDMTQ